MPPRAPRCALPVALLLLLPPLGPFALGPCGWAGPASAGGPASGDRALPGPREAAPPAAPPHVERGVPLFRKDYAFSAYWFTQNAQTWRELLLPLAGRPDLHYLEIGVFEGMAALWMLENVLTHPEARLTAVDIFPGDLERRYRANLELSGFAHKTTTLKGASQEVLKTLPAAAFDVIYVDGSHEAADVMADAVLSWPLLEVGGLLIFDDYRWSHGHLPDEMSPRVAVDAFVTAHRDELEVVHRHYQLAVRKKPDPCGEELYCSTIGDFTYQWQRRELRRRSDGAPVRLSSAERTLLERLGRARPYGRTHFEVDPKLRQAPGFRSLVERLGLDL